jgi:hypothetical protein
MHPDGAIVEIVEYTDDPDPKIIVPNAVRINGQELLVSDDPVTVESISMSAPGCVLVNLTLIARRVTIAAEPKPAK